MTLRRAWTRDIKDPRDIAIIREVQAAGISLSVAESPKELEETLGVAEWEDRATRLQTGKRSPKKGVTFGMTGPIYVVDEAMARSAEQSVKGVGRHPMFRAMAVSKFVRAVVAMHTPREIVVLSPATMLREIRKTPMYKRMGMAGIPAGWQVWGPTVAHEYCHILFAQKMGIGSMDPSRGSFEKMQMLVAGGESFTKVMQKRLNDLVKPMASAGGRADDLDEAMAHSSGYPFQSAGEELLVTLTSLVWWRQNRNAEDPSEVSLVAPIFWRFLHTLMH